MKASSLPCIVASSQLVRSVQVLCSHTPLVDLTLVLIYDDDDDDDDDGDDDDDSDDDDDDDNDVIS